MRNSQVLDSPLIAPHQDSSQQAPIHPSTQQSSIPSALQACRQHTRSLVEGITPDLFCTQSHPDFSPVGWHLGHIAYTESLWIAEHLAGLSPQFQQYEKLFAADGLPKSQRQNLPGIKEVLDYLAEVRSHTLTYLKNNPQSASSAAHLWHWLIQHEGQHAETIAMVLAMQRLKQNGNIDLYSRQNNHGHLSLKAVSAAASATDSDTDMVLIPAGNFQQGYDGPEAIDNERPAHDCSTARYWLDRSPVTCGQYRAFIEAGGYQTPEWWCKAGWQWQQSAQVQAPLYWPLPCADDRADNQTNDQDQQPVCGVSWYEADAYARFVGKRLPTETEWEKAAGLATTPCEQMLGTVWEWTDSWFAGYPGFRPFPYEGYSQTYFDGAHRVLRGGSWASPKDIIRPSFRNWYHPHRRELFAGFRCAA